MLAQKHNKLRHKHYLLFICQLIISLSSIFINSANPIQVKVTKDKPINHTGPSIHYVSFLEDDKQSQSKFPSMRIVSIPQLDGIPITTQMFSKIHQNQRVFPSEINLSSSYNQYKYIYTGRHFAQYLRNHFVFIKELGGRRLTD